MNIKRTFAAVAASVIAGTVAVAALPDGAESSTDVFLPDMKQRCDINGDGTVNDDDLALIYDHITEQQLLIGDRLNKADINRDSVVDIKDYNLIYAYIKANIMEGKDFMKGIEPTEFCPDSYSIKKNGVSYVKDWREETDGRNEIEGGESYYSSVCKKDLPVYVVLPKGYDKPENKNKKYPVMYVFHGFFGHRYSMMVDDGCDKIITNLIEDGSAREMIVVYPHIYVFNSDKKQATGFNDLADIAAYDRFVDVIAEDLMPYMSQNYRVLEGRENTAVFGFSMGGREALAVGFTHPDKFGYIGATCPAPGLVPAWGHEGQFKSESELVFPKGKEPYLLMLCAAGNDNVVGDFPVQYHNIFDRNKLDHIYYVVSDSWHGGPAIRSMCYNFTKNVFKASSVG